MTGRTSGLQKNCSVYPQLEENVEGKLVNPDSRGAGHSAGICVCVVALLFWFSSPSFAWGIDDNMCILTLNVVRAFSTTSTVLISHRYVSSTACCAIWRSHRPLRTRSSRYASVCNDSLTNFCGRWSFKFSCVNNFEDCFGESFLAVCCLDFFLHLFRTCVSTWNTSEAY